MNHPETTDSGSIPIGWQWVTIQDAYEICDQSRLPLSIRQRLGMRGPYPYYGPTGILDHINEYRFDGSHALIGEDGDNFLKFATHPMTLMARGRFNVNNHAHVIGSRGGNLVEWFQVYFENRDITTSLTRQGAGRYKLTKATLRNLPIPLPPKPEQRAIVESISNVSDLLETIQRCIAKKQAVKQGMMQQLLTGRTRLPGFNDPWTESRIGELASVDPETLPSGTHPGKWIDYISLEDVNRGQLFGSSHLVFAAAPSRARRIVRAGDVLFATVRPNLQSHLLYSGGLPNPIASTGFAVLRSSEDADPAFIFNLLMSDLATIQIDRIIAGSNYPAVSSGDVRRLVFGVPSIQEQRAISGVLADAEKEIAALRARRDKANAIKQGMMQELLTGRTRLPIKEVSS